MQTLAVMAGGADGQRLLAPLGEIAQCPGAVHLQGNAQVATGHWQHLQRHFRQQPKAAVTACQQARQIVTGDILHHFAAKAQVFAQTGDYPGTEHEVAH